MAEEVKTLTDTEIQRLLNEFRTWGIAGEKRSGKSVLDAMLANAQKKGRVVVCDALGVYNPENPNKTALIPGSVYYDNPEDFTNAYEKHEKKHVVNFSTIKNKAEKIEKMNAVCDFIEELCRKDNEQTTLIIDEAADFIPQAGLKSESLEYTVKNGANWRVFPVILTTQRPQRINKDEFELSDCYIIFKQLGENTLKRLVEITNAEDAETMKTRLRALKPRHFLLVYDNEIQEYKIPDYKFAFAQH